MEKNYENLKLSVEEKNKKIDKLKQNCNRLNEINFINESNIIKYNKLILENDTLIKNFNIEKID